MASRNSKRNAVLTMDDQVDALRADMADLRADFAALMKDVVSASRTGAGEVREQVFDEVQKRIEQLGEAADSLKTRGRQGVDRMEQTIADQPLASVGTAFGVGMIIGFLLHRR